MVGQHSLPFPVLTDPGCALAEQFGLAYTIPSYHRDYYRSILVNIPFVNGDDDRWRLILFPRHTSSPATAASSTPRPTPTSASAPSRKRPSRRPGRRRPVAAHPKIASSLGKITSYKLTVSHSIWHSTPSRFLQRQETPWQKSSESTSAPPTRCVAVMEGGEPKVIANEEGAALPRRSSPSPRAASAWSGQVAKRQAITNPENTVFSIKRFMGRRYDEVDRGDEDGPLQGRPAGANGDARVEIARARSTPRPRSRP